MQENITELSTVNENIEKEEDCQVDNKKPKKKPFDRIEHLKQAREKARIKRINGKIGTTRQKKALQIMVEKGCTPTQALREAGYSKAILHNPSKVLDSKYFQTLLNEIDDRELTNRLRSIALDEDKRASLSAIDMLLKLKDRYPANKLKVQAFQEELGNIIEGETPFE